MKFDNIRKEYKAKLNPKDYPGTVSLIYELDVPICVITNDGSTIIGELTSFDQYGNIIVSKARARVFTPTGVQDVQYGVCYFRTEDVVLVGRIDKEKETEFFTQSKLVPPPEEL